MQKETAPTPVGRSSASSGPFSRVPALGSNGYDRPIPSLDLARRMILYGRQAPGTTACPRHPELACRSVAPAVSVCRQLHTCFARSCPVLILLTVHITALSTAVLVSLAVVPYYPMTQLAVFSYRATLPTDALLAESWPICRMVGWQPIQRGQHRQQCILGCPQPIAKGDGHRRR